MSFAHVTGRSDVAAENSQSEAGVLL